MRTSGEPLVDDLPSHPGDSPRVLIRKHPLAANHWRSGELRLIDVDLPGFFEAGDVNIIEYL